MSACGAVPERSTCCKYTEVSTGGARCDWSKIERRFSINARVWNTHFSLLSRVRPPLLPHCTTDKPENLLIESVLRVRGGHANRKLTPFAIGSKFLCRYMSSWRLFISAKMESICSQNSTPDADGIYPGVVKIWSASANSPYDKARLPIAADTHGAMISKQLALCASSK